MTEYLTTKEVAELMRVKQRKIYDLVARSDIPFSKTTGKLLFPKQAVLAWINKDNAQLKTGQLTISGSHDPLLEAVLRRAEAEIATIWNGSSSGLELVSSGRASAAVLHIFSPNDHSWNLRAVQTACTDKDVVLLHWAKRTRGLVMSKASADKVTSLADIQPFRVSRRQPGAGAQILFDCLLEEVGLSQSLLHQTEAFHTELDSVLALLEGQADIAFGLQHLASRYNLAFLPLITEYVDIVVDRKMAFEPAFQSLLAFCRTEAFTALSDGFDGYDTNNLGAVRLNI